MNLKYLLSLCSVLMLTQTIFTGDTAYFESFSKRPYQAPKYKRESSFELNKYIDEAKRKEIEKDSAFWSSRPDFIAMYAALVGGTGLAYFLNPAVGPVALAFGGIATGPELISRFYKQHQYYSIKAPYGFANNLKNLEKLIDTENSMFMGSKEYMLAENFNDLAKTGYLRFTPTLAAVCSAENPATHQLANQQYEIYVMPNDSYLVDAFGSITKALKDAKIAQSIAFIAIRPTPILTNAAKQILPRIVIVLKQGADKKVAEQILQIAYTALKNETYIKSVGYQPRYSQQVTVQDNAWTPVTENLKKMFFIGMGNTDFKMLHPEQFERKKFLGITRQGDMAYPLNTPEADKVHTIVINK